MTTILATLNNLNLYHKIKKKMFCACILEKHEIKYCESKRNIYKIDLIRNQIMENKLDEELEKDGKVK